MSAAAIMLPLAWHLTVLPSSQNLLPSLFFFFPVTAFAAFSFHPGEPVCSPSVMICLDGVGCCTAAMQQSSSVYYPRPGSVREEGAPFFLSAVVHKDLSPAMVVL